MLLKNLYENLIEKTKERGWQAEEILTKEKLSKEVIKFIKFSKISVNKRYEGKIILEFKEDRDKKGLVECIYSAWEIKKDGKKFKEGSKKPEDIVTFALSQENEIEKYVVNLMEELNKKYFFPQFTRIRSKT